MPEIDIGAVLAAKAPRLARFVPRPFVSWLRRTVREREINHILRTYWDLPPQEFIRACFREWGVTYSVEGLERLDPAGRYLFASNHPFGGMDGMMLADKLTERFGDARVVVNDDVAVKDSTWTVGRRGVAGTVFVHKIAGALAETGADLDAVQAVAQKVIDNVRTMGAAIEACIVPAAGKPGFELGEDEMEVGIGIHGEPGTHREKLRPADEIVDMLMEQILSDLDFAGQEVAVMINSSGATPLMELFIINNHVADVLAAKGVKVYKTFVGEYMTSIEMAGFSISLLKLDDQLKGLLDAKADTPGFKA